MPELLKDKYLGKHFYRRFASELKQGYPQLDEEKFYRDCIKPLTQLELMQRISHTSETLARHLPGNYFKALDVLYALKEHIHNDFGYIVLPDFVARYGLQHPDLSLKALRDFTEHSSSEFAIREFLTTDLESTLKVMQSWTEHENHHIRRLASEGCRPRLPWGKKLDAVIRNPAYTWKILEALKKDDELYVRKSVANHINDISKDHPQWLTKKLGKWPKTHPRITWIMRHGCRSLIKKGDAGALQLLGFNNAQIEFGKVILARKNIMIGNTLEFEFRVENTQATSQKLVIDYRIYFRKKNGELSAKTFKLKTFELAANSHTQIYKKHRLAMMSTRRLYPGIHQLEILVNGNSQSMLKFNLTA